MKSTAKLKIVVGHCAIREILDITVIQRNLQSGLVDMKKPSGTHISN